MCEMRWEKKEKKRKGKEGAAVGGYISIDVTPPGINGYISTRWATRYKSAPH
jgi:hypothetical protein